MTDPRDPFDDKTLNSKYLEKQVVKWTDQVDPRPNHWDRRVETTSPLTKPGLYVIDAIASAEGNDATKHHARTFLWVQDTVIVRNPLKGKTLYRVADAKSGESIADANVEFFGWGNDRNATNRKVTKNFAMRTDREGQVVATLDTNINWFAAARTKDGRLALLDYEWIYDRGQSVDEYRQMKAYGVSDRPIYRPGDKVKTKFWLAYAVYGDAKAPPMSNVDVVVSVVDEQNKQVIEKAVTTDRFGGCEMEFDLETTAGLGRYRFQVDMIDKRKQRSNLDTNLVIRVEEYRKPEFEVNVLAPRKPVALGETIEARIQAKYYFGAPVTDADVSVKVERTSYRDTFYPVAPYDWCYGPGYWWFAEDYTWYPNWNRFACCTAPSPWWIGGFQPEPPELVLEQNVRLDSTGEAKVSIDTALAKAMFGANSDHRYKVSVEVRDASRRTITAEGEIIAASEAFKIYSWLDRGFYRVGEAIQANFHARMLDGTGVKATGKMDLLRITYDADAKPVEQAVATFDAATDDDGQFTQRLVATQAGQYRIRLQLTDETGHMVEGGYVFTVRGEGVSGKDFRYNSLELIPDRREYRPGETVQLQIAADEPNAVVALFIRPENGAYQKPRLVQLKAKSAIVEIPVSAKDQPNFFVEAYTVYGGQVHYKVKEIVVPPEDRVLNMTLSSDKSEYLPGEEAEVTVLITSPDGEPVQGACAIAVYDRSLEQIAADVLPIDIREFFWKWRRSHYPGYRDSLQVMTSPIGINNEQVLEFLGIFGYTLADDLDAFEGIPTLPEQLAERSRGNGFGFPFGMGGGLRRGMMGDMGGYGGGMGGAFGGAMPMAAEGAAMADATPQAFSGVEKSRVGRTASGPGGNVQTPSVRKDFADSALWLGSLQTDQDGRATAKFKMPENMTGWKLRSWGVSAETQVGSASAEAVTRKPLLVRLQTPRFLIERDEIVLSTIVHNELNETKVVRVSLEVDGETQLDLLPATEREQIVEIKPHEQARVDWRCKAMAAGEVTVRTLAITEGASDAMQLTMPIVVYGTLKTDSWAGTVRDGQPLSTVLLTIPEKRRIDQSKLTVRLSPSLAASMMDALPYLSAYPYGCSEQTLNRFLPTVITQQILREMQVDLDQIRLRQSNLNTQELGNASERRAGWKRYADNPIFDSKQVDEMVASGVQKLSDMQNEDGGWGWFPGQQSRSTAHLTASILRGLLIAQENGVAIVPDVPRRAILWLEQYQNAQLQSFANFESKTRPYRAHPDNTDALVFHVLVLADQTNEDMQNRLYEQRTELSVYGKALLAWATHRLGNAAQTSMLRRNIEQFLVQDAENETAYLTDQTAWWYWYASQIEATAMYLKLLAASDPKGEVAPRLVKYLLNNRKHATYWNSTRDTAIVVEAFGDYLRASGETKSSMKAEVFLSGKRIGQVEFTPENLFEVDNTIEIAAGAIPAGEHELEIRRTGGGNLYWNVYSTNFTQEDDIERAGLEVKIERRYYRLIPEKGDLELAGQRGVVASGVRAGYERVLLQDGELLASGELVEVELLVESKNDYEYLLIEDRKPACLEAVDTSSGYFYSAGLSIYRELRDQHIGLCVERLPRGKFSIRYQLRSEAPGQFTALPATIEGMYAPELAGNSQDFDIGIVDE